jgi:uncharacterized OB-fold protein
MNQAKTRVPAVEGWFRMDDEHPQLLGTRCTTCGTYFWPRESSFCRNPDCSGREFEEVALSRHGRVWSWTVNHYPPPPPFVAAEPFVPYAITAVELADEKMVVLGQLAADVDPSVLRSGLEVELTLGTLFEDEDNEYVVWKWRPVSGPEPTGVRP